MEVKQLAMLGCAMTPERLVIVMASVFGDESYDKSGKKVFAVAAIVGTDRQWDEFVSSWQEITGGQEFHAAEWESEFANHPDRQKHKERLASYRKLTEALAWSGMHGWGVAVDFAGYIKAYPHINHDFAYHKCFIETVVRIIRDSIGLCYRELKFTFDNRQGQGSISTLYEYLTSWPEWKDFPLSFADKMHFTSRRNPRIQAADLLARETMKALDHKLQGHKLRASFATLASTCKHFQFDYLMPEYFAQMREGLDARIQRKKRKYAKWLLSVNAQDTIENRYRYEIWRTADIRRRRNAT
jgi:hypothetical protein